MLWLKKGKKRAMIVGLDGVPFTLVKKFCADGTWKFMDQLQKSGALRQMQVTLPEISAVSWPSFMTGKNPAEHAVFGFMEIDRNTYGYTFPNFLSLKTPTFWEELGLPAVAMNIPQTYPAKPF
jgi:predicted AlkP superfamily phosphohydrolase/phosphomutase